MPTNPDWIEHTEKAAWETVEALREQVQHERQRSERLVRLEPSLPRIAELLDELREELGMWKVPPVKLLDKLREHLRALTEERDALREELAKRPSAERAGPPRAPEGERRRTSASSSTLRWFAKQLKKRQEERERDADLAPSAETLPEVATTVEDKLRRLVPLPYAPAALLDVALDLGLVAMDLARAARRAQRSG